MPQPHRKQRRINPDKAPWNTLPVIVWTPDPNYVEPQMTAEDWGQWLDDVNDILDNPPASDPDRLAVIRNGTVTVTRGPYDIATLPERCLSIMEQHPGKEFVVETDGLGRIGVAPVGALTDAHLADIGVENTGYLQPLAGPNAAKYDTLAGYAQALHDHAARTLELANQYDKLVADGWDLAPTPPPSAWWPPLRRTASGQDNT